jgi:hypothetical protein
MCNVQCPTGVGVGVAELALVEPRAAVAAAALDEACQVKQVIKQREQGLAAWASVCDSEMSWRVGEVARWEEGIPGTRDCQDDEYGQDERASDNGYATQNPDTKMGSKALALLVLVTRFQAGFATGECSYSPPSRLRG